MPNYYAFWVIFGVGTSNFDDFSPNIRQGDLKMGNKTFKTPKNRALGTSIAHKFTPGDIVSWKTWLVSVECDTFEEREGLLVEILEETRLENIVLIAKVLAFGGSEYEFIPLFSVQKSEKRN